jgi:hypothetical protein
MPKKKKQKEYAALRTVFRTSSAAEQAMNQDNKRLIRAIKRDIRKTTSVRGGTYNYNKKLDKAIRRQVTIVQKATNATGNEMQRDVKALAVTTIVDASRVQISAEQVSKIISNVDVDRFSKVMRPSFSEYRHDLLFHLKRSIGQGKSVEKLAKDLTKLDPVKVDIPAYIRDIEQAARRAIRDPKDFAVFKRTLRKHERYINNLTRAGEPGFEHLGLRRAGQAFVRDIKKAVNENTIDNIVNRWAQRKLGYIQKRVARTETSNAYHKYLEEYAFEADHIIGLEVVLSAAHPEYDICDELAGVYLYDDVGRDIPIPEHHPQCICGVEYIFEEEEKKQAA